MSENHTPNSIRKMFIEGKNKMLKYQDQFFKIFNVDLHRFMAFHGFDIIKFDIYLKTPDGTSTKDFIKSKYGDDAVNLILKLISF